MEAPMVTVICVCYNQGPFVSEAIHSVLNQTHRPVQLVVVDDGSCDNSVEIINECVRQHPAIQFVPLPVNTGYCKAFNHALRYAKGDYIIDFAADDILLPDRISKGVAALADAGDGCGVHFTDAYWIAEDGSILYKHSQRFPDERIPQGDIYRDLVECFFICSPAMMFRRKVIDVLGGYDESLSYEDFDFWIRSSRAFFYCYSPEVFVKSAW
jgi:glycosyltransferase involved in cell wall biosynthesis